MAQAVVDTNFIVAVMVEDDRNHRQAIRIWQSIESAFVPTIVLFELAYFLVKYKLDLELLERIVTDPKVEVVSNNLDDIIYLTRHSDRVKYYDDVGDLLIISASRRLGAELKTFDDDLRKLAIP